jgi:hypothetical protein
MYVSDTFAIKLIIPPPSKINLIRMLSVHVLKGEDAMAAPLGLGAALQKDERKLEGVEWCNDIYIYIILCIYVYTRIYTWILTPYFPTLHVCQATYQQN